MLGGIRKRREKWKKCGNIPRRGDASCRRISKRELAYPGWYSNVGAVLPRTNDSTYLLREGSGRGPVMGYKDSGLSTRAIAAAVIQYPGASA
ncbi:hypothetical protein AVEN_65106-1 [Araneus ventricosus]|uniref:Uncharacterized protein n=1 Tax=Araneus ventricosus TaxID=182803 RepID=A0A4Y2TC22_ARAVE|nr:hypothetical protein AVEN_65106-1 [Araneus ventricosus]